MENEKYILFAVLLAAAAWIDVKERQVPDELIWMSAALWWIFGLGEQMTIEKILIKTASAVIFYFGLVFVAIIIESMGRAFVIGGGDLKLIACIYLYMGFDSCLWLIGMSGIIALVWAVICTFAANYKRGAKHQ